MGVTFFEPPFFTKVFIKEAIFVLKIAALYMLCMGMRFLSPYIKHGVSGWIFLKSVSLRVESSFVVSVAEC